MKPRPGARRVIEMAFAGASSQKLTSDRYEVLGSVRARARSYRECAAARDRLERRTNGYLHSNRVSSNRSLCFRETEFCAQRQRQRNIQRSSQRAAAETKLTSQLGRFGGNYRMAGKSPRQSECVLGRSGQNWALEFYRSRPNNRLSGWRFASNPEHAEADWSLNHCRTASTAERARRSRRLDQSSKSLTSCRFTADKNRLKSGPPFAPPGHGAKLKKRSSGTLKYRARLTSLSIGIRFLPSSYFWNCWKLTSR